MTTVRKPGEITGRLAESRDETPSDTRDGSASEPSATRGDIESFATAVDQEPPEAPPSRKAVRRATLGFIGLDLECGTITKLAIEPRGGARITWTEDELQNWTVEQVLNEVRKRLAP